MIRPASAQNTLVIRVEYNATATFYRPGRLVSVGELASGICVRRVGGEPGAPIECACECRVAGRGTQPGRGLGWIGLALRIRSGVQNSAGLPEAAAPLPLMPESARVMPTIKIAAANTLAA